MVGIPTSVAALLEDSEACGYHSETDHRLTIYTNGSDFLADMFLPSHWESQTRHQVASRSYRTMHWWRFVPSLDLEMLGN